MQGISRETFEGMDDSSKLNVLYDCVIQSHKKITDIETCTENLDKKLDEKVGNLEKRFDRRKKFDTSFAGGAGFIGGFVAYLIEPFMKGK